jgi:iron complex transport system substrate-binding protein
MAPSITEVLFAVGAGARVVGVSAYTNWPPEAMGLPRLGGHLDVSVEALVALRPDLVITNGKLPGLSGEQFGLRVEEVVFERVEDIFEAMRQIGAWVGEEEGAAAAQAQLEAALAEVRAMPPVRGGRRALLVVGRDAGQVGSVYCASGRSFLVSALEVAGGEDALGVEAHWPLTSLEQVVRADPDVIIELAVGEDGASQAQALAAWRQALPGLQAVAGGRVYVLRGEHLTIPGPRLGQTARDLAQALRQADAQAPDGQGAGDAP